MAENMKASFAFPQLYFMGLFQKSPAPYAFCIVLFLLLQPAYPVLCSSVHNHLIDIAMITWRSETPAEKGFKDFLSKSDWQVNYRMYNAEQSIAKLHRIIANIKEEKTDLVYVFGTTATRVVLSGIKDIPVLFNVVTRPVETGIINTWEHSGNNATGVSSMVPLINQLRALKKVVDYQTLGIIYNPGEPNSLIQRNILNTLSSRLNFELMEFHITSAQDVESVIPRIKGRVDAVYLPSDSRIISLGKKIMNLVNQYKIPSLSAVETMVVQDDALMGLVPDYYDLGTLAASKAIRIFNGDPPGEIPCSTLKFFHISVNMKTARKTGVQIPSSLLIMSDTIIR